MSTTTTPTNVTAPTMREAFNAGWTASRRAAHADWPDLSRYENNYARRSGLGWNAPQMDAFSAAYCAHAGGRFEHLRTAKARESAWCEYAAHSSRVSDEDRAAAWESHTLLSIGAECYYYASGDVCRSEEDPAPVAGVVEPVADWEQEIAASAPEPCPCDLDVTDPANPILAPVFDCPDHGHHVGTEVKAEEERFNVATFAAMNRNDWNTVDRLEEQQAYLQQLRYEASIDSPTVMHMIERHDFDLDELAEDIAELAFRAPHLGGAHHLGHVHELAAMAEDGECWGEPGNPF